MAPYGNMDVSFTSLDQIQAYNLVSSLMNCSFCQPSTSPSVADFDFGGGESVFAAKEITRSSKEVQDLMMTSLSESTFKADDVVWAPYGQSLYPAQVTDPNVWHKCEMPYGIRARARKGHILVHYFHGWDKAEHELSHRMYASVIIFLSLRQVIIFQS